MKGECFFLPPMDKISAIIITRNEERNIGRCLASLRGVADEVVVVDSGSTDATGRLATEAGATFLFREWTDYSDQKNYANGLAAHPWILSIDADEALSDELRETLLELKRGGLDAGCVYAVKRLNNYCGRWIRHSGWYPDEKVRLWRAGAAHWDGLVHEELVFHAPLATVHLKGDLLHYTYTSVADHASRQLRYATLAAEKSHAAGRTAGAAALWLHPAWTFFRNYVLKGGFRDGKAGLVVCRMAAYYTFLKYAILRNLSHASLEERG